MRYIALNFPSFPDNNVEYIAGIGKFGDKVVEQVGRHILLPTAETSEYDLPQPPAVAIAPVTRSSELPAGDDTAAWHGNFGANKNCRSGGWDPESFRLRLIVPEDGYEGIINYTAMVHRAFTFALLRQVVRGNSLILHGALLYDRKRNLAAVLFGMSGIGKSTASLRFTRQGGEALADDKLLLTFSPDGKIYAQPTPTWSRIRKFPKNHKVRTSDFSFHQQVPVGGVFLLTRGEGDRIAPAPNSDWMTQIYRSASHAPCAPGNIFPVEVRKMAMAAAFPKISQLRERAGVYQILGDLDGDLYDNLSDFMKGTI